jgi:hypothetical protein
MAICVDLESSGIDVHNSQLVIGIPSSGSYCS